jgi:hypothetical protein
MAATGGRQVKGGYYFNPRGLRIVAVSGKTGALAGDPSERFVRVPGLAVLLLAPILGGMFVVFLPVIGFVLVGQHFLRLVGKGAGRVLGIGTGKATPAGGCEISDRVGTPEAQQAVRRENEDKK